MTTHRFKVPLQQANAARITQAGGGVSIGTTAHLEGVLLAENSERLQDRRIGEQQTPRSGCGSFGTECNWTARPIAGLTAPSWFALW